MARIALSLLVASASAALVIQRRAVVRRVLLRLSGGGGGAAGGGGGGGSPCLPRLQSTALQALLISNSKVAGLQYLDHVAEHIKDFLGELEGPILFVPFALADRDGYAAKFKERFAQLGYTSVGSLHECETAEARRAAVRDAACIFVGGGNTYRLLRCLQEDPQLLPLVRERVAAGELRYIGSSAGTNLACPTIRNTNDMPIVWPEDLRGLGLVPFQINTHYIDAEREVQHHMGETREKRLQEFLEENAVPVLALREGSTVCLREGDATLLGPAWRSPEMTWDGARLFAREGCRELGPGASLDFLLAGPADVATLYDTPLGAPATSEGPTASGDKFQSG